MNHVTRLILAVSTLIFNIISSSVYAVYAAPVITRIKNSRQLMVGTTGRMPLMSEKLLTDNVVRFDDNMANAMSDTMGVKLILKMMPIDHLIPALEQGKVDVVFSNMSMTVDRNMRAAVAEPYFVSGNAW